MKNLLTKISPKLAIIIAVSAIVVIGGTASLLLFPNKDNTLTDGKKTNVSSATPLSSLASLPEDSDELQSRPKRKVYPIGKWDMDIPYLNPFGSQDNYHSTEFSNNQRIDLTFINDENKQTSRKVSGDRWTLIVNWSDNSLDPFEDLLHYVFELGGDYYRGADEHEWIIHGMDAEGNHWWGRSYQHGKGYTLQVFRELRLRDGHALTIRTSDYPDRMVYFMTENEQIRYQSIQVTLDEGTAQLTGGGSYEDGRYSRGLYYTKVMESKRTNQYTLNDIPQETGTPMNWQLTWSNASSPKEITLNLDEGDALYQVQDGERLGALKVRGIPMGYAHVSAQTGVTMKHPELNLKGDLMPDGDILFWLPTGYWNLNISPGTDKRFSSLLNTRLVPVNEGEMTLLEVNPLVSGAYENKVIGNSSGSDSQLTLTHLEELGDQAKISFMLLDSESPKFNPSLANTAIMEGGQAGKVVSIQRLQTPPSVVLALDSSGSMAGSMTKVIESARIFIQGLPDNAFIRVIDFDSQIRLLDGSTKEEVLKSLSKVKAEGATTLNDSIIQALQLLEDQERPSIVVFTDGVDSNTEGKGSGSKATKDELLKQVKAAGIPIYTIGFGKESDETTLVDVALMADGTYYTAADPEALNHVFASINERLGNNFEMIYERPKEVAPSNVPVISLTIDVSGSMDIDPSTNLGDYRMDKVKHLYHEFIKKIPDQSLMQLVSFSDTVVVKQVFTHRKIEILQALGELKANGGTDINNSTLLNYKSLKEIPSDKRMLVYLTDAALNVNDKDKELFEKTLTGLKEEGIMSLWVGLGTDEAEEAFKWAAETSGGRYVISEDPDVLAKAFQEALDNVQQKKSDKVTLSLSIKNDLGDGNVRVYTKSELASFSTLHSTTDQVKLDTINIQTGTPISQYGTETASLLYGRNLPGTEVKIYRRVPLDVQAKNKAMEWKANDLFYMKSLGGVEAPSGKTFLAIDMEMKNIHPEGADYLIPDFASHFFISLNSSGSYPASTVTWLAESPLANPGENQIMFKSDETIRGVLVFIVPDEHTAQAALNFYDTSNGHIALTLTGEPQEQADVRLTTLPTKLTGKLSSTFDLAVLAEDHLEQIMDVSLARKNSSFNVIEAQLLSNVQALLNVNPQERFYMRVNTGSGPFMIPMSNATALLPHGFLRPVFLGPGSSNTVRLAFQTPNALKTAPADLYADLYGSAMVLPIRSGATGSVSGGEVHQGNGVTLSVNALQKINSIDGSSGKFVVADVTITDTEDTFGSSGFKSSFTMSAKGADGEQPAQLRPDKMTTELLLGIQDDQWSVFDGKSRRGFLVFNLPSQQQELDWRLQSSLFTTLDEKITAETYKESDLLVRIVNPKLDNKFDTQLSTALFQVVNEYKALQAASRSALAIEVDDLDAGEQSHNYVAAPLPAVYGLSEMKKVKSVSDFQLLMDQLDWLPSANSRWNVYRHSPESVLAQGWGSESDLANLAGGLLAQLGYKPALKKVTITEDGKKALQALSQVDEWKTSTLPAWAYRDKQGKSKLFVLPFMKDLKELSGLAYLPAGQQDSRLTSEETTVTVHLLVEPTTHTGIGSMFGAITDALGGSTGDKEHAIQEIRALQTKLPLVQLGNEPVDIRFGGQDGLYQVILENQLFHITGNQGLDPNKHKLVGMRIEVARDSTKLVHTTTLPDDQDITGVFHTLAINLPDMHDEATSALQKSADQMYKAAKNPDVSSTLSWYTRNMLYRFVVNQSKYEKELAEKLTLTTGRTNKERVLVMTVRRKDNSSPLRTSIDLMQSANQVHNGSGEAKRAFNIMSGLYASRLEGQVLMGDKADFIEVWSRASEDTKLFLALPDNRKADLVYMKEQGYPEFLIQRVKDSRNAILTPNQSTRIYGEDRWVWLEIDPLTFETIAVLDTGEHGGMAEYVMAASPSGGDYQDFMTGAFLGVTVSVWSMSSFSLILDDYEDIVDVAKAYTIAIGQSLDDMMNYKDLPKLEYGMGPVKVKLEDQNIDYLAKYFEEIKDGKEVKGGQNILGFSLGFNSGVAYYFKQVEEGMEN